MKYIDWSSEKNEILKRNRDLSFEEITLLIESGNILGIEENPGYPCPLPINIAEHLSVSERKTLAHDL